jgi:hypothetical protein
MAKLERICLTALVAVLSLSALFASRASAATQGSYTWTGATTATHWSANNWTGGEQFPSVSSEADPIAAINFPDLSAGGSAGCDGSDSAAFVCYGTFDDIGGSETTEALNLDDDVLYTVYDENAGTLEIDPSGEPALTATPQTAVPKRWGNFELGLPLILHGSAQTWADQGVAGESSGDAGLSLYGSVTSNEATTPTALTVQMSDDASFVSINTSFEVGDLTFAGQDTAESGAASVENGQVTAWDLNGSDLDPVTLENLELSVAPSEVGSNTTQPTNTLTTGPLTLRGAYLQVGDGVPSVAAGQSSPTEGTLAVNGSVSLDSETVTRFFVDNSGNTPGSDYSQLTATGSASLGGALTVSTGELVTCPSLAAGNVETLISASGTISGEFSNAPNGSTVSIFSDCAADNYSPISATISYSAHAVTLEIQPPATTPTPTPTPTGSSGSGGSGGSTGSSGPSDSTSTSSTITPAEQKAGAASVGRITTSGLAVKVPVSCEGSSSCQVEASLTGEITTGSHALGRSSEATKKTKAVSLGRISAEVPAGKTVDVRVTLNATAKSLLTKDGSLKTTLTVEQISLGSPRNLETRSVRFKSGHRARR